ncbi:hypothetical protein [Deinococcus planocerae]|uniref:hypothetical protein n=1 Tax=Deinococcus planocerae TaxID=1737569 RepID=UPI0011AFC2A4|nr:hypothetical protein [Deinococcus planocerae]
MLLLFPLAALLVLAWAQRQDPLDLWVAAGLIGLGLGLGFLPGGGSRRRLGLSVVFGQVLAVTLLGVRKPGVTLGFAAALVVTELAVGRLFGRR